MLRPRWSGGVGHVWRHYRRVCVDPVVRPEQALFWRIPAALVTVETL